MVNVIIAGITYQQLISCFMYLINKTCNKLNDNKQLGVDALYNMKRQCFI